ncbi:MAG: TRAP transporter large permease [Alphaproteobacteria bacterium]
MIDPLLLCAIMALSTLAVLMTGYPVAFVLAGSGLLFALIGAALGVFHLPLLAALPQSIFGLMQSQTLVAVPLFVFMGVVLEKSSLAADLVEAASKLLSARRGGLAVAVIGVGALLAATTGIVGATITTLGLLALPPMLAAGYRPGLAAGTVAASGTLGQIIPPSIALVLLGDQISIAYQNVQIDQGIFSPRTITLNDLFAACIVPGLALAGLYAAYVLIRARFEPDLAGPIPGDKPHAAAPDLWPALLPPLLLVVAVLGSILAGLATPTEAAGIGAVGALLLAARRAARNSTATIINAALWSMLALVILASLFDLRPQRDVIPFVDWLAIAAATLLTLCLAAGIAVALRATIRTRDTAGLPILTAAATRTLTLTAMIFAIVIGARLFSLTFRGLGGADFIEDLLLGLPGGATTAVFMVMATIFVLGFFLDFLEILYIVVPVTVPVLLALPFADGSTMSPLWLGALIALNLQTSFLTPPFGIALFYLRSVAPDVIRTADIYRGVAPFVILQLLMLAIVWAWPVLATGLPALLGP